MANHLPPLGTLRTFEAAARHLSFTRAAEELHVTQAAVSYQIKRLEEDLGLPLFRRLPRHLLLTDEGQGYLPAGSKLPGEISEVMETAGAAGFDAHRDVFEADAAFRQWVLRPDYLDIDGCYTHPDLQPATESG